MILLVVLVLVFILCLLKWGRSSSSLPTPPHYPFSLPVFGNLLSLGNFPHLQISEYMYKHKYPIISMKFGSMPVVLIKDATLMHEAFVTKSQNFSHRPLPYSMEILTCADEGGSDLIFGNAEKWKKYRRIVATAFTRTKLRTQQKHLLEELVEFDYQVSQLAKANLPVEFSVFTKRYSLNIVQRLVFGTCFSYNDTEANETSAMIIQKIKEIVTRLGPTQYLSDYIPMLAIFDSAKQRILKQELNDIRALLYPQIDDHKKRLDPENPRDLVDAILIEAKQYDGGLFTNLDMMLICMDMYLAGTDTSSVTIAWILYFLAKCSEYQEKIFTEISNVIGKGEYLKYADLDKTPLLNSVIQEASRMRPPTPLSVLRTNIEDDSIGGYFIPKKTAILWNIYAYNHDPELWTDPDVFYPERFLTTKNILHNFGGGARICVGRNLGEEEIYNACAMLVQRYTWKLDAPYSDAFDQGVPGAVLHPSPHKLIFSPRQ